MATPPGSWIRLHVGYPRNRKVRPLTDPAFRLHVELLCWAAEEGTDGLIDAATIPTFGRPPKVWKELRQRGLLVDAGGGDLALHDFLEWQEPAEDMAAKRDSKRAAQSLGGSRGNHEKWHVKRGLTSPECAFCHPEPTR